MFDGELICSWGWFFLLLLFVLFCFFPWEICLLDLLETTSTYRRIRLIPFPYGTHTFGDLIPHKALFPYWELQRKESTLAAFLCTQEKFCSLLFTVKKYLQTPCLSRFNSSFSLLVQILMSSSSNGTEPPNFGPNLRTEARLIPPHCLCCSVLFKLMLTVDFPTLVWNLKIFPFLPNSNVLQFTWYVIQHIYMFETPDIGRVVSMST
jgi:hypothetical protein